MHKQINRHRLKFPLDTKLNPQISAVPMTGSIGTPVEILFPLWILELLSNNFHHINRDQSQMLLIMLSTVIGPCMIESSLAGRLLARMLAAMDIMSDKGRWEREREDIHKNNLYQRGLNYLAQSPQQKMCRNTKTAWEYGHRQTWPGVHQ